MRLIDADALLKDINDYPYGYRGMIKDTIARQPTIEPTLQHVESVGEDGSALNHGHWVRNDNGAYSCSECQSWIPNEQHYYARYCLHCGAKMDEVEKDENDKCR